MWEITQTGVRVRKAGDVTYTLTQVATGKFVQQNGMVCESSVGGRAETTQIAQGKFVQQND